MADRAALIELTWFLAVIRATRAPLTELAQADAVQDDDQCGCRTQDQFAESSLLG